MVRELAAASSAVARLIVAIRPHPPPPPRSGRAQNHTTQWSSSDVGGLCWVSDTHEAYLEATVDEVSKDIVKPQPRTADRTQSTSRRHSRSRNAARSSRRSRRAASSSARVSTRRTGSMIWTKCTCFTRRQF